MVHYLRADLDQVFHALSDGTRRDILMRLDRGSLGLKALCQDYGMSLPAVSKHVKVLESAGLVVTHKEGRVRQVVAQPKNLKAASDWVRFYERYWTDALERFAQFAEKEEGL